LLYEETNILSDDSSAYEEYFGSHALPEADDEPQPLIVPAREGALVAKGNFSYVEVYGATVLFHDCELVDISVRDGGNVSLFNSVITGRMIHDDGKSHHPIARSTCTPVVRCEADSSIELRSCAIFAQSDVGVLVRGTCRILDCTIACWKGIRVEEGGSALVVDSRFDCSSRNDVVAEGGDITMIRSVGTASVKSPGGICVHPCSRQMCLWNEGGHGCFFTGVTKSVPGDFATIQEALKAAQPGDTIKLEQFISGPILVPRGVRLLGGTIEDSQSRSLWTTVPIVTLAPFAVLEKVTVNSAQNGPAVRGLKGSLVHNCYIHNMGGIGIQGEKGASVCENVVKGVIGIMMEKGALWCYKNIVRKCTEVGIVSYNSLVENNTLEENVQALSCRRSHVFNNKGTSTKLSAWCSDCEWGSNDVKPEPFLANCVQSLMKVKEEPSSTLVSAEVKQILNFGDKLMRETYFGYGHLPLDSVCPPPLEKLDTAILHQDYRFLRGVKDDEEESVSQWEEERDVYSVDEVDGGAMYNNRNYDRRRTTFDYDMQNSRSSRASSKAYADSQSMDLDGPTSNISPIINIFKSPRKTRRTIREVPTIARKERSVVEAVLAPDLRERDSGQILRMRKTGSLPRRGVTYQSPSVEDRIMGLANLRSPIVRRTRGTQRGTSVEYDPMRNLKSPMMRDATQLESNDIGKLVLWKGPRPSFHFTDQELPFKSISRPFASGQSEGNAVRGAKEPWDEFRKRVNREKKKTLPGERGKTMIQSAEKIEMENLYDLPSPRNAKKRRNTTFLAGSPEGQLVVMSSKEILALPRTSSRSDLELEISGKNDNESDSGPATPEEKELRAMGFHLKHLRWALYNRRSLKDAEMFLLPALLQAKQWSNGHKGVEHAVIKMPETCWLLDQPLNVLDVAFILMEGIKTKQIEKQLLAMALGRAQHTRLRVGFTKQWCQNFMHKEFPNINMQDDTAKSKRHLGFRELLGIAYTTEGKKVGIIFMEAVRSFCSKWLTIAGVEADSVMRLVEDFAKALTSFTKFITLFEAECLPVQERKQYKTVEDIIFALTYAVMMLNTSVHNKNNKQGGMDKLDFLKFGSQTHVSREVLRYIFKSVKEKEMGAETAKPSPPRPIADAKKAAI